MPLVTAATGVFQSTKRHRMAEKPYIVESSQLVRRPLAEVFAFFARAENLEILTPEWLHFRIRSVQPEPIQKGTLITYSLRLHGIPLGWTSEITDWEPPHRFVDLQLRGPYKLWRHEHRFQAQGDATLITDRVELSLPFGPLGHLVYKLKVRSDVQRIFAFREQKINAVFP